MQPYIYPDDSNVSDAERFAAFGRVLAATSSMSILPAAAPEIPHALLIAYGENFCCGAFCYELTP